MRWLYGGRLRLYGRHLALRLLICYLAVSLNPASMSGKIIKSGGKALALDQILFISNVIKNALRSSLI